ncbi:MAG TPA: filamentous hemagglutinin N-terminal domain-containing protein [Telluria sp.]|nr:filamentous hemagglutinin N-terminal domain-containing protein [Telluria sp.]
MKRLLPLLLASAFSAAVASPTSPSVVAGQATFHQNGNVFTITNTPGTIINWQSFSVGAGEVTRFVQQSASSAVLNRILGQDPTQILGALQSNGHVFLINPNGIMFGKDARVDVGGLTASTLNMTDADFLAGRNKFSAGAVAGNISNQGALTTATGGHVFLVAPNVENNGIITAPNGDVVLAAGRQVQLVDSRDPDLHVVVSAPEDKSVNLGQVISQGGRIGIYGALVNQRGAISANSAVVGANGKIVLRASGDTLLEAGSTTTATGAGKGGSVHVLGNRVGMTGNATIDVSGATGGGTVLMGGDYRGGNPLYASAQQTIMGKDASIKADATFAGKGGKVILWATGATRAFGSISAQGGATAGDGGFIETSAEYLDVNGIRVNTRALHGASGVWLLDPNNIKVGLPSGEDVPIGVDDASFYERVPLVSGHISVATLLAAGSDIVLEAKNNITFNDALNAGEFDITARAGGNINVDAPLTTSGGNIILHANNESMGGATGTGAVNINNKLRTNGGNITLAGDSINVAANLGTSGDPGAINSGGGLIDLTANALTLNSAVVGGPSSGTSRVNIMPYNPALPIWMGGSFTGSALQLTNAQIGNIHAGQIRIGGTEYGGDINWSQAGVYSAEQVSTFALVTQGGVTLNNLIELQNTNGYLDIDADNITVTGNGSVTAPNVSFRANRMQFDGNVNASGEISILPGLGVYSIAIGDNSGEADLALTATELAKLRTNRLNIGESNQSVDITLGQGTFTATGTNGRVIVDAGYGKLTVKDAFASTGSVLLHTEGDVQLGDAFNETTANTTTSNAGVMAPSIDVHVGPDGALSMSKGTRLEGAAVTLVSNTMNIEGGASIGKSGGSVVITPRTGYTDIELGSGAVEPVEWFFRTLHLTDTELRAIKADRLTIGDYNQFEAMPGEIIIKGSLDLANTGLNDVRFKMGYYGMKIESGAVLRANDFISINSYNGDIADTGTVVIDGTLEAVGGTLQIEAESVRGNGLLKGSHGDLIAMWGIYGGTPTEAAITEGTTAPTPLKTQFSTMWVENDLYAENATPVSIGNTGNLRINGLFQYGDGSIALENTGAVTMRVDSEGSTVHAHAGDLKIKSSSSLSVDGGVSTTSGNIALEAGAASTLTVTATTGSVRSDEGNIDLNGGTLVVPAGSVSTGGAGQVRHNGTVVGGTTTPPPPPPPPVPSLETCLANNAVSGCTAVLKAALDACIAYPGGALCSEVLPDLAVCLADRSTPGCEVVLPDLAACIADRATPGCDAILPSVETCIADRTTAGCSVVLPNLATCIADKTIAGCQVVLPQLSACIADRTVAGCEAVLPQLSACIADRTIAGCQVVLPQLSACIADRTISGCEAVLPQLSACIADRTISGCEVVLPQLSACIADKTIAGCQAVLPQLSACIADKTIAGCQVVLPQLSACIADKTIAGCQVVLPQLSACIADKTIAGCQAVLPQLSACIADKTIAGCQVVLPQLSACIADKSLAGCEVVLPQLTACIADKTISGCQVVLPQLSVCIADKTTAGCEAVLPELTACIADKTMAGCQVVLPKLTACIADKTIAGCQVVLPALTACIADKTVPGCQVVLPPLSACIANKTTPGCAVVLPSLPACIVDPTAEGCQVVLPTLAQCVIDKTSPGCQVVLPTLAECIGSPSLAGCGVVLPSLEQCAVNPNREGCVAVLPKPDFCATHPTDPQCQVLSPQPQIGKSPLSGAVQATVNLVNTNTQSQAKPPVVTPPSTDSTPPSGGTTQQTEEKPDDKKTDDDKTTAQANTGAKNEKPAKKTYCN